MKKILFLMIVLSSMIWNVSFAARIWPHPRTPWWLILTVIIILVVWIILSSKNSAEKNRSNKQTEDFFYKLYESQEENWAIVRNIWLFDMPFKVESKKVKKNSYIVNKKQEIFWMDVEVLYEYASNNWFLKYIWINFENQKKNEKKIIKWLNEIFIWREKKENYHEVTWWGSKCSVNNCNTCLTAHIFKTWTLEKENVKVDISVSWS